jgi:hypothetical protein
MGLPWGEVQGMGSFTRKAFLYAAAVQNGAIVDWTTGRVRKPKEPHR